MYFNKIFKHSAALFEIVAPSRGLVILVSFVNIIQGKCNFISIEFVGYKQKNLPKDLKELLETNRNLNSTSFVSGRQGNHKRCLR